MRETVLQPHRTTVFVIDDDEAVRESQRALLMDAGFVVHAFGSGEEGLPEIPGSQPDCVVLDIHMPGMNGFDVLERITAETTIPVILITGRPGTTTPDRARARGAAAMLEKPLEAERLIGAIGDAVGN
jgi:FixJ family two-component response regulator